MADNPEKNLPIHTDPKRQKRQKSWTRTWNMTNMSKDLKENMNIMWENEWCKKKKQTHQNSRDRNTVSSMKKSLVRTNSRFRQGVKINTKVETRATQTIQTKRCVCGGGGKRQFFLKKRFSYMWALSRHLTNVSKSQKSWQKGNVNK